MTFGPHPSPDARILSLGAGVQSTTMALVAAHGALGQYLSMKDDGRY